MYASIDQVMGKLERQIRGAKGTARARRHDGDSLKAIAPARVAAAEVSAKPARPAKRRAAKKASTKPGRASKSR